jgi:hypothetical protein
MKSYVFQVELAHEDDGRWSTWIDVCPAVLPRATPRKRHCRPSKPRQKHISRTWARRGEILPSERGQMGSINAIFAGPSCAPSSGAATAPADGHAVPTALASPLLY